MKEVPMLTAEQADEVLAEFGFGPEERAAHSAVIDVRT